MTASYKIAIYPQNVATIHFAGTLDPDVVKRAVEECLNRQCYSVVVDLSEVSHAPSNGMGAFLAMRTAFEQRYGRMAFIDVDGTVKIVIELMGFHEIFRFYPDLNQALMDLIDVSGTTRRVSL